MKKLIFFLFFIALFSFSSFAQTDGDEQTDETSTTTEAIFTPMSTTNTSIPRCPHCYKFHSPQCKWCTVCKCWHYPVCPPPHGGTTNLPIDGGVGILLVAGAAYGAKRRLAKKKPAATV